MDNDWNPRQKAAAKELFGRPLRAVLAAWILARHEEPFYLLEAQQAMQGYGEAPSGVTTELRNMEDHGMLTRFQDGRRVYFLVQDSPYWTAMDAIASALGLLEGRSLPGAPAV